MKTFKIYAPAFHGFYNTMWEPNLEADEDDEQLLHGQTLEFDNKAYENSIGEAYCDAVKELLSEFITEIKFEGIDSPREYNFTNDKIECEVKLSKTNLDSLAQLIYDNKLEFEEHLKDVHSSRSGFISFLSNDFNEWEESTKKFTEFEDERKLQSIFEFALELEQYVQNDLFNTVHFSDTHREYQFTTIKEDETKYARICMITGHGMNDGFVVNHGDTICNDEEILCKWLRENIFQDDKEALKLGNKELMNLSYGGPVDEREEYDVDGDYHEGHHYYTVWDIEDDEQDYYYTARGEEIQLSVEETPAEKIKAAFQDLLFAIENNGIGARDGELQETFDAVILNECEFTICEDEGEQQFTGINNSIEALKALIEEL